MRSGKLRHKIQIQSFTKTKDSLGGVVELWTTKKTTRCSIKTLSGTDGFTADQFYGKDIKEFRVRFTDVSFTDRIIYKGDIYDIKPPIKDILEINKELLIIAERNSK